MRRGGEGKENGRGRREFPRNKKENSVPLRLSLNVWHESDGVTVVLSS